VESKRFFDRTVIISIIGFAAIIGIFIILRPFERSTVAKKHTFVLTIHGDTMKPSTVKVRQGDFALFKVRADHALTLRFHDYAVDLDVAPHKTAYLSVKFIDAGSFELEDVDTGRRLGTLIVKPI